jgi:dipeptidyl aminopeptidase/acylaminoacyl peptidase
VRTGPPALNKALALGGLVTALALTISAQAPTPRGAREPAWAPDGKRIAFSYLDRIWTSAPDGKNGKALRPQSTVVERDPAWSPDGTRIAFFAVRERAGSVWVVGVEEPAAASDVAPAPRPRPAETPILVSRRGARPAWAPDGKRIAIGNLPVPDPTYNGNPERNTDEPPPLFASANAFRLWTVDAPLPVDAGAREVVPAAPQNGELVAAFDRVWERSGACTTRPVHRQRDGRS